MPLITWVDQQLVITICICHFFIFVKHIEASLAVNSSIISQLHPSLYFICKGFTPLKFLAWGTSLSECLFILNILLLSVVWQRFKMQVTRGFSWRWLPTIDHWVLCFILLRTLHNLYLIVLIFHCSLSWKWNSIAWFINQKLELQQFVLFTSIVTLPVT